MDFYVSWYQCTLQKMHCALNTNLCTFMQLINVIIFGSKYDWVVSKNYKESPQTMVKELKLAKY